MSYFFGIYGYEFFRSHNFKNWQLTLTPRTTVPKEANELARAKEEFNLTGVGQIFRENDTVKQELSLFDLTAALTFCQQQSVILWHSFDESDDADPQQMLRRLPKRLDIKQYRPSKSQSCPI